LEDSAILLTEIDPAATMDRYTFAWFKVKPKISNSSAKSFCIIITTS
jgi:hypothetical protein